MLFYTIDSVHYNNIRLAKLGYEIGSITHIGVN